MSATATEPSGAPALEDATFEVFEKRLAARATELGQKLEALDARRQGVFGGSRFELASEARVRTEHACISRDVVSVGPYLAFGWQVFLGLKRDVQTSDVLALYRPTRAGEGAAATVELAAEPLDAGGGFFASPAFTKDLADAFRYGQDAHVEQLRRTDTRLLVTVRTGPGQDDRKVFRFSVDGRGSVAYLDARGEDDAKPPEQQAFRWVPTTREHHVSGQHPHVNVLDTVFVETVGGDLTVKVENNTKDGQGIFREPVDDANQQLDDAEIAYAEAGALVLLRVRPFREDTTRFLVYARRAKRVRRLDAVGLACQELPEGQGIVFPNGVVLDDGEAKIFDVPVEGARFEKAVAAPNGEDVLYVFYRPGPGEYLLLPYNLVKKEPTTLLRCHGWSLSDDGTLLVLRASEEPTRVHALQVWTTPFVSPDHEAPRREGGSSYLAKVGNKELVRGLADLLSIQRLARSGRRERAAVEELLSALGRAKDGYYWLGHAEAGDLQGTLGELERTGVQVLEAWDRAAEVERRAAAELEAARAEVRTLALEHAPADLASTDAFLVALGAIRRGRGRVLARREVRGIDRAALDAVDEEARALDDAVVARATSFFLEADAFAPLVARLDALGATVDATALAKELAPLAEELERIKEGLEALASVADRLAKDDAPARTRILEGVSGAFSRLNRTRALFDGRKKELAAREGAGELAAQVQLFVQGVTAEVAAASTPDLCDASLSKMLLRLEELEARFGDVDAFAEALAERRDEVSNAFAARRQTLVDEREKRVRSVLGAAERILAGAQKRAKTYRDEAELLAYFDQDPSLGKLVDLGAELGKLGASAAAEELAGRAKSIRQDALRALRDARDLEGGEAGTVRFGRFRFAVQTRPFEAVLAVRDGQPTVHVTGTELYAPTHDPELLAGRAFLDEPLVSETREVYRGEYLATALFVEAERADGGAALRALARDPGALARFVEAAAKTRVDEGYEPGVHDADATAILARLVDLADGAGLLRFGPDARALAQLAFAEAEKDERVRWAARARGAARARSLFGTREAEGELAADLAPALAVAAARYRLVEGDGDAAARLGASAADYLVRELSAERPRFVAAEGAEALAREVIARLDGAGDRRAFEDDVRALEKAPVDRFALARGLARAAAAAAEDPGARRFVLEAAAMLALGASVEREPRTARLSARVSGLVGVHPRLANRELEVAIDETLERVGPYVGSRAAAYRTFRDAKARVLARERDALRLEELRPKVLTSFVRNRLVDEVYLPLVGTNLAKQIGALGSGKRTDTMGLLLLVSPPGYGKTTLMEWVAATLGLVFVKVNGPALGHEVTGLDPSAVTSATARQELEKIGLALEMGQNVMLYLDDIQHTSPELLQKFISLCDAQRKIEGVFRGKSRTYDLKGKRFVVVMAGNPYTETGETFRIPDMLANRADTYNLGDVAGEHAELFASSYLENALASSPVLAPLAGRSRTDLVKLLGMARGEALEPSGLEHGYSAPELDEIVALLRHLGQVSDVLMRVNGAYVGSASQDDAYRTAPPFKLQGSYRNMAKLAEKVVAAMTREEVERLVDDHYDQEAQTLTTAAEQNLLALGDLRGRLTPDARARWTSIKAEFARVRRSGGEGADPATRVTGALAGIDETLARLADAARTPAAAPAPAAANDVRTRVDVHLVAPADAPPSPPRPGHGRGEEAASLTERIVALLADRLGDEGAAHELRGLGERLARIEQKLGRSLLPPARVEAEVDVASPTNFFSSLASGDPTLPEGLFVATWGKPPALGASVRVALRLPGNQACEVDGTVAFHRDDLGDDAPAGFGVRFAPLDPDVAPLLRRFVSARAPLVIER